ncbi:VOC family protein [uncultured Jatrophihabitans sp.]|uniref:VOC family protein n=1 Tax=uncultured Jatrophihabitans sp. TaxID=1610747 RepID=UPI0035CB1296
MPPINLNPYIAFRDNARQAMTFYQSVFGGELNVMTFADGGMPHEPAEADRVMHAQLEAPDGLVLMAADTPSSMEHRPGGSISISLSGDDEAALTGYWEQLSGSGMVHMPLEKAPWGDSFGMCADQFGVQWMVNISGAATS